MKKEEKANLYSKVVHLIDKMELHMNVNDMMTVKYKTIRDNYCLPVLFYFLLILTKYNPDLMWNYNSPR